jgi:hypothetical protein
VQCIRGNPIPSLGAHRYEDALREVLHVVKGTFLYRSTVERLRRSIEPLVPLVQQQGGHHGVGEHCELAARVWEALELARCTTVFPCWKVYHSA